MKKISFYFICPLLLLGCNLKQSESGQSTRSLEKPNIIMIEVDDLTAKYLGFNGGKMAQTPTIDELAKNGVVFSNAVVQGTMCTPSRNSFLTGLYPHNLGMYHNLDLRQLPTNIWTFPKELKKLGYTTMFIGKNHLIPNLKGHNADTPSQLRDLTLKAELGFDTVYQSMGRAVLLNQLRQQSKLNQEWPVGNDHYGDFLYENNLIETFRAENGNTPTTLHPDREYMDGYYTSLALENLQNYNSTDPFFMWLNFSGPHTPFDPPKEYIDRFKDRFMLQPIDTSNQNYQFPKDLRPQESKFTLFQTLNYRKRYQAAITYMDEQVGRLLSFLKESKFKENTVLIFFSDHGIMTGDHGLLGKETLYKEVLNPSLIIYQPNEYAAKEIATAVELIDVGATVIEMAGGTKENRLHAPNGHSLLPLIYGDVPFEGAGFGISETEHYRSIYDGTYKYIDHPEHPFLFNLLDDPDEIKNIVLEKPEIVKKMKMAIDQWLENTRPVREVEKKEDTEAINER